LLYPVRGAEVEDFVGHFEANRTRFFLVLLGFQAIDFLDAVLEHQALGTDWSAVQLTLIAVFALGFLIAIRTSNRAYHGILAVAWLLVCIGWGVAGLDNPILVEG
jgi:hypothetical protein